ncbi:hypothetical protein AKO1_008190 [Acrasis kona]|uniref:Uncharacterized protein n=1 Tax=Acrasis kona TaxID=1008807 RepID=A0AAW2YMV8_9EUKA
MAINDCNLVQSTLKQSGHERYGHYDQVMKDTYIIRGHALILVNRFKEAYENYTSASKPDDKVLQALLLLSTKLLESSKEHTETLLTDKLIELSLEYEKQMIKDALSAGVKQKEQSIHAILEDLDPLPLDDVVSLVGSSDISARSLGITIFIDYALQQNQVKNVEEIMSCGGLESILQSLIIHIDGPNDCDIKLINELQFFATKAICDLCSHRSLNAADRIIKNETVPFDQVLDKLSTQIQSHAIDFELSVASISALSYMIGSAGGSHSNIIFDSINMDSIMTMLQSSHSQLDKNCEYITQALYQFANCASPHIKFQFVRNESFVHIMMELSNQSKCMPIKFFAISIIGKICQNPELWGHPEWYQEMSRIIDVTICNRFHFVKNLLSCITTHLKNDRNLAIICVYTLTQLFGFNVARNQFERFGGEDLFCELEQDGLFSAFRGNRYYKMMIEYGDCIGRVLSDCQYLILQDKPFNRVESLRKHLEEFRDLEDSKKMDVVVVADTEKKKKKKRKRKKKIEKNVDGDEEDEILVIEEKREEEKQELIRDPYRLFVTEFERGIFELAKTVGWGESPSH